MSRRVEIVGTFLGTLLSAAVLHASAQPARPEAEPEFGASLDVRVVNVEAVVTDRKGNPVEGLGAGDFRLLVDGWEAPIEYFTEVRSGQAAAPVPSGEGAAPASPVPPGGVGVSYLVFVDEAFTLAADRDLMLSRLENDLRLGPDDRMAIVAFNGGALDLLSDWTGDAGALKQALRSARERPANGIQSLVRRRQQEDPSTVIPGELNQSYFDAQASAEAAAAAMRAVPPAGGRKVLFLVSGGWPVLSPRILAGGSRYPFEGLAGMAPALTRGPLPSLESFAWSPTASDAVLLTRPADLFEVVTGTANLLGYTIYPLNGPSHEMSLPDVETLAPGASRAGSTFWEMEVRIASDYLTRETGGKAVFNSFRRSAFQQVAADLRSYYWLGFSPLWKADGHNHDIRVEVRRPDLRVRNRSGYSDLTQEAQAALATESLLLFGGGPDARTIEVQAGTPRRAGLGRVELPLTLSIPAEALTPSPVDGQYELRARLAIANVDRWGGRSRLLDTPLRLTLPEPPRPGDFARYKTTVEVRRIRQQLTFAVQDETGGGKARGQLEFKP